jgi:hypothetical protein
MPSGSGLPSISVQIVQIHPDTLGSLDSHEGEAFRRETISTTAKIVSKDSSEFWVLDSGSRIMITRADSLGTYSKVLH